MVCSTKLPKFRPPAYRVDRSSCYNFHVLKHIMQTKRATLLIFSMRQDESLLMKISKTLEIRVNILKILRNKQTLKKWETYPLAGVSFYTTWGKLLHLT